MLFILILGCVLSPNTDDCAYPNNCPYTKGCVAKWHPDCINPDNNLSFTEEVKLNLTEDTDCCTLDWYEKNGIE